MTAVAVDPLPRSGPWSAAEDAILRARYQVIGAVRTAAELGRTLNSVHRRAQLLEVFTHRRWTEANDRTLGMLWGELPLKKIARTIGRTEIATYWRARKIGLPCGCQDGFEYVRTAAIRCGFAIETFRRILRWAGMQTTYAMSREVRGAYRCRLVETERADDAVARWMAAETVTEAARARGMIGETLTAWLEASGIEMPPRPGGRRRWRVPSAIIDQVIAARAGRESVSAAAKRLGIWRTTLRRRLVAAGHVPPRSCATWWVERAVIDGLARKV